MVKMPYSRKWQRTFAEFYDEQKSKALLSQAQSTYESYLQLYAGKMKKSDQAVLQRRILPGLSIYKALLEENDDQEKVFIEVETLFRSAFFTTRIRGIRLLNLLPAPFKLIKPALRMMTKREYLPGSQKVVEDSRDCFAVDVYRCLILDMLTEHGAAELTVLYCKTDDWLAECLPKVSWERTKTLGRGDDCCDFRWCRK